MRPRDQRGLSTLEALVAIGLLAVIATALARTLAESTRARALSSRQMLATERAMSVVEQLRSGYFDIADPGDGFEYDWSLQARDTPPGLSSFSVTVRWPRGGDEHLQLEGLLWHRP